MTAQDLAPEAEAPRPGLPAGAGDAVTFAFGDPAADAYGVARVGLADGRSSGLGVLFTGGEPVAVRAAGDEAVAEARFEAVRAAGVTTEVVEPLRRWRVAFEGAFALEVEALAPPSVVAAGTPAAKAGGMEGYEQLCRFRGEAAGRRIDCLGQRGHAWGRPDWERIAVARTVSAWLAPDAAVTATAVRSVKAKGHDDEAIAAFLIADGVPLPVAEPRLSTTYDGEGRQRHAGLELFMDAEGGSAHRLAGEAVCGTTLDLGRLRLDTAFFAWRMAGRTGVGRYDIVRPGDG